MPTSTSNTFHPLAMEYANCVERNFVVCDTFHTAPSNWLHFQLLCRLWFNIYDGRPRVAQNRSITNPLMLINTEPKTHVFLSLLVLAIRRNYQPHGAPDPYRSDATWKPETASERTPNTHAREADPTNVMNLGARRGRGNGERWPDVVGPCNALHDVHRVGSVSIVKRCPTIRHRRLSSGSAKVGQALGCHSWMTRSSASVNRAKARQKQRVFHYVTHAQRPRTAKYVELCLRSTLWNFRE